MDFNDRLARIKPTVAIGPTVGHTRKVLFKPFLLRKWLKIGLINFIIYLGLGVVINWTYKFPTGWPSLNLADAQRHSDWLQSNMGVFLTWVLIGSLILSVIWAIFLYFSSQFSFVFLDGVVADNFKIKESIRANKKNTWSFFIWQVVYLPTALLIVSLVSGIPFIIARAVSDPGTLTLGVVLLVVLGLILMVVSAFLCLTIFLLAHDFVLPIMSLQKVSVWQAWRILRALMKSNRKAFLIYVFLRWTLSLLALVLLLFAFFGVSVILMLVFVPMGLLSGVMTGGFLAGVYLALAVVVALLANILYQASFSPVNVFFRVYPLSFLEGMGVGFASINRW